MHTKIFYHKWLFGKMYQGLHYQPMTVIFPELTLASERSPCNLHLPGFQRQHCPSHERWTSSGHDPATHQRDQRYSCIHHWADTSPRMPWVQALPSREPGLVSGAASPQTQENQNPLACRPSMSISKPETDLRLAGPWPCPLASQQTSRHSDPKSNCVRN